MDLNLSSFDVLDQHDQHHQTLFPIALKRCQCLLFRKYKYQQDSPACKPYGISLEMATCEVGTTLFDESNSRAVGLLVEGLDISI